MSLHISYLYLLSPLHTGAASQEGNLVGIARESHSELPYLPSSTLRGRLRAATPNEQRSQLWGHCLEDVSGGTADNLTQGNLWLGDAALLWFPVPSLSHGVVWITSPFLLRRWARLHQPDLPMPAIGSFSGGRNKPLYLRDVILPQNELQSWDNWTTYRPTESSVVETIEQGLVLSNEDCQVLIQASLWRQVRVNLSPEKIQQGGFRYEEAIPPETLLYFPWSSTTSANGNGNSACQQLTALFSSQPFWQFGGQESLGRGLVSLWTATPAANAPSPTPQEVSNHVDA